MEDSNVPNLDAMDPKALLEFWFTTNRVRPIRTARAIFPACPQEYVRATKDLGHYASNKATAMHCRMRGDISTASMYEDICERIYQKLPAFARW